jgi:membrane carboxypeptidase/penicillin-binding protein
LYDSTNIAQAKVAGIAPISLEHTDKLGKTVSKIAVQKCGIIKGREVVVSGYQTAEVDSVIEDAALERECELWRVGHEIQVMDRTHTAAEQKFDLRAPFGNYYNLSLNLLGEHQIANAAQAIGLAKALEKKTRLKISDEAVVKGVLDAHWPGRLEKVEEKPLFILDGAQNKDSAEKLVAALHRHFSFNRLVVLLGTSQDEYRNNAAQPLILNICPSPGVKNHVNEMILRQIENSLGENLLLKGQLTVESSIDLELQAAAEEALAQGIAAYEKRHVPNKGAATDKAVQAAMVVIEPSSGEIVALVGGRDYKASPFNRVTQAKRQNGSAFKPILYALAIDNGYNQSSLMQDAPATYQGVNSNSSYNPDNYSGKFLGPITLRRSLELSLNSVALQLASRLGVAPLQRLAAQLGINADLPNNLTIALGSGSVSLLELTSAYSSFFSNGTHSTPHFIRTVHTPNDEVLIKTNVATNQVLRPEVAYVMRDLLRGVVLDGTAQAAKSIPCFTAGKTGTSNSYRDALFIGAIDAPTGSLIPKLVAGVWIGFDDNHTLGKGESGMVAALPLWLKFAQAYCPASAEANQQPFSSENLPANIIIEKIDHSSGKLATERCQDTIEAAFIKGSEPHELCPEELP